MTFQISRRRLAALPLLASVAGLPIRERALAQEATPVTSIGASWPLYGHDLSGAKATQSSGVSSASVRSLEASWQVEVDGPVSSTPVIADGVTYVGSYDGNLYAVDLHSGERRWTYASGADVMEPNLNIPLGIPGSAAVNGDTVYVGDASATVHAVDRASGNARWTMQVDDQENACIWSSPVVARGTVYVGVASVRKEEGFRGNVVALDAATGDKVWQTYMVPEGADGAGVFAVPAIDEERGMLYVGTQNAYSQNAAADGHPMSIVALDMASGELVWAFDAAQASDDVAPTDDLAFSASPNLFQARIGDQLRDLVGEGQKSGVYWALDRDSGEVVWQTTVSPPGMLGGMEGTSAVANGVIVVPATDWPDVQGPAAGLVSGLDAATGEVLWSADENAPAASPAAIADDIALHAGIEGVLHTFDLQDGAELSSHDLGASVSGGIAAAAGVVVLGVGTPPFGPFVTPGNFIQAFTTQVFPATPAATPLATPVMS